jgi:N-acetylglutamate synthase-like GNAT family acetyltransferase
MKRSYHIVRQALISGIQIEDLRSAVGWESMPATYDSILVHSYTHFSIMDQAALIGFVNVISDGIGDALLVDLMVHPDYQHQGLGKALVIQAINDLRADGIQLIQVVFEPELEAFYRECGFHIVKAGIIDNRVSQLPEVM